MAENTYRKTNTENEKPQKEKINILDIYIKKTKPPTFKKRN